MRKAIFTTVVIGLLAVAPVALGSARLTNVELSYEDGHTIVNIDVVGTVHYTHQTEIAKDGKPFRVIVDVLAATHNLGAKTFFSLPASPVQAIRSSQYSVKPEKVARVVFDMDQETMYRIDSDGKSIKIHFPDKLKRQFPKWSTSTFLASQTKKAVPVVVTTKPKKTSIEVNAAIGKDRLVSLQADEVAKVPVTIASKTTGNKNSNIQQKTVSVKPVTPSFSEKDKWAVLYEPPQQPAIPPVKIVVTKPKEASGEATDKVVLTAGKAVSKSTIQPKPKSEKASPLLATVDESVVTTSNAKIEPKASVQKKISIPKVQEKSKAIEKPVPKESVARVEDSAKPKISKKDTAGKVTKKTEIKATSQEAKKTPAETKEVVPVPTVKKVDLKKKSTSRFRRSPAVSKKIKGTLVAEFPKRLVIKYKSTARRDPFETLINEARILSSPIQQRVPNVEGLRLVGTIESEFGSSALFEDTDGYSYILQAGDKIQKGYVLRVESDRVYFQIFEYGWSRTMALNIEN